MKKAIVQISTAILGIGDTHEDAMDDARRSFPDLTNDDLVPLHNALAGETVSIDISDELAEYGDTDSWGIEDGVAILL